jgi:hypothetical protein
LSNIPLDVHRPASGPWCRPNLPVSLPKVRIDSPVTVYSRHTTPSFVAYSSKFKIFRSKVSIEGIRAAVETWRLTIISNSVLFPGFRRVSEDGQISVGKLTLNPDDLYCFGYWHLFCCKRSSVCPDSRSFIFLQLLSDSKSLGMRLPHLNKHAFLSQELSLGAAPRLRNLRCESRELPARAGNIYKEIRKFRNRKPV